MSNLRYFLALLYETNDLQLDFGRSDVADQRSYSLFGECIVTSSIEQV